MTIRTRSRPQPSSIRRGATTYHRTSSGAYQSPSGSLLEGPDLDDALESLVESVGSSPGSERSGGIEVGSGPGGDAAPAFESSDTGSGDSGGGGDDGGGDD